MTSPEQSAAGDLDDVPELGLSEDVFAEHGGTTEAEAEAAADDVPPPDAEDPAG